MKCRFQMASAPPTELWSDWGIIRHLWVHITSSFVSISVWVQWGSRKSNQSDNGAHYAQTSSVVAPFEVLPQNRHCVGLSDTLICITGTRAFTINKKVSVLRFCRFTDIYERAKWMFSYVVNTIDMFKLIRMHVWRRTEAQSHKVLCSLRNSWLFSEEWVRPGRWITGELENEAVIFSRQPKYHTISTASVFLSWHLDTAISQP